jgi:hypothetical protein
MGCHGLVSLGGSRVHGRRQRLPSSELQALVCRRNPGSGSTAASLDPRSGVPSKPAVRGPQVSGDSRAFSSSNRVACDAVNDKPIAPADKRMDLRGKKAPAVEPAARAMAPTSRSRSWNVKIPLNQGFMKKWDSRETHINTGEFFGLSHRNGTKKLHARNMRTPIKWHPWKSPRKNSRRLGRRGRHG